jgi:hypothetical protein
LLTTSYRVGVEFFGVCQRARIRDTRRNWTWRPVTDPSPARCVSMGGRHPCGRKRAKDRAAEDSIKYKLHQDEELSDRVYGYIREYY